MIRYIMLPVMGLLEGTRGREEREGERQRLNNAEIHCISVGS
jgi:hypothetical protein